MNKATNTDYAGTFRAAAGIEKDDSLKERDTTRKEHTSPSEKTVVPIQEGNSEKHFEPTAEGRPVIPVNQDVRKP